MTNGTVQASEFYIRHDDGSFEDGCPTLEEAKQFARDIFNTSKRKWRGVSGIYQDAEQIIGYDELTNEFYTEEEKEAARMDDEDGHGDFEEHNTHYGLPSYAPSAYRGGW